MANTGNHKRRKTATAPRAAAALCIAAACTATAAWEVRDTTDEMTGKVSQYVVQESEPLKNARPSERNLGAFLGLTCDPEGGRYYVRALGNWAGLHARVDCSGGYCDTYQRIRMRFDHGAVHETRWTVWERGSKGASYTETSYTGRGSGWLTENLRAGARLRMELDFAGVGRRVLQFNLNGFTAASSRCGRGEWARAQQEKAKAERNRMKEARRRTAEDAQLLDEELRSLLEAGRIEYIAQIKDKIERNWLRPPGTASGRKCVVRVSQIPGGEVVQAEIQTSSGNIAFDRSVEEAVLRSSPLPVPKDPSLFDRHIVITFEPEA